MTTAEVEAYRAALRIAVGSALSAHADESATVMERSYPKTPEMWSLHITPVAPGAVPASLAYGGGDEVTFTFGETHCYLFDDDPNTMADEVQEMLEAVFAGNFIEAGPKGDSMAKLTTGNGELRVGSIRLPVPWRLRRTRTYAPYSAV